MLFVSLLNNVLLDIILTLSMNIFFEMDISVSSEASSSELKRCLTYGGDQIHKEEKHL